MFYLKQIRISKEMGRAGMPTGEVLKDEVLKSNEPFH